MQRAMFYVRQAGDSVVCRLCPHNCRISPGQRGRCGVRENRDGVLYSLVYGRVVASHVDPIEKKPLFHLLPGSKSYSLATVGCNLGCRHCQNWQIAQYPQLQPGAIPGESLPPEMAVEQALVAGCSSIAYTYTEPTIYFEYAFATARLAAERGLKNVFVSNGYTSPEALEQIAPYLAAANIDLKSFSDDFYRTICAARLQPVLEAIRHYHRLGIWLEVTTLIIPGYNDDPAELRQIAEFLCALDPDIPWHVSAFYPTHKLLDAPRTPAATLRRARQIGLETGLHYVYQGNIPGEGGENSSCPACGNLLLERYGFSILHNWLQAGSCPDCGAAIAGVWE